MYGVYRDSVSMSTVFIILVGVLKKSKSVVIIFCKANITV